MYSQHLTFEGISVGEQLSLLSLFFSLNTEVPYRRPSRRRLPEEYVRNDGFQASGSEHHGLYVFLLLDEEQKLTPFAM
jgi:hypothetical protein